ncbi:sensor histidine kinase [Streptomyces sp. NPDC093223]|uniref:sensor histidine kinase n=1 Tax=Streptomyces sp. NPDC093223 TaxID=3366033 RepID=UPI003820B708
MRAGASRRLTIRTRLTLTYGVLFGASTAAMVALVYVIMMYGPSYSPELTKPTLVCQPTLAPATPSGQPAPGNSSARPLDGPAGSASASAVPGSAASASAAREPGPDTSASTARSKPSCMEQRGLTSFRVSTKSDFLKALLVFSAAAGVALLLITLVAGWYMAGRMLARLQRITTTARGIADSTLHERIDFAGPSDEIKELADTFDAMLTRLDQAFQAQRRFAANASHELRTPLAAMRTILQVALSSPDPADLRAAGAQLLVLNKRSSDITEALLTLARSDHGAIARRPVDLADLAREACDQALAAAAKAEVKISRPKGSACVLGDPILLRQLVANLIDNAVKHNYRGGTVLAEVTRSDDGSVRFTMRNSGPVLDQEDVRRAFEPFHRLDTRVQGATGRPAGFGLGLAIVHAIVQAHGGTLTATPARPDGLEIAVVLPPPCPPHDPSKAGSSAEN